MATIVNARDVQLQAVTPRTLPVALPPNMTVPPSQVDGLPEVYSAAKEVVVRASSQVFQVPKVGAVSPTNLTLTAVLKNITGTPTFTVVSGTASLNVSGNVATLFPANMSTNTVTVEVSVLFNSITYKDTITIVKVAEGIDSVVGLLTNESCSVAADSAGVVTAPVLAASGGTFYVYDGVTNKTGTAAVTYSVVSETGVDLSIASTGVYTVNSMSADTGRATLRAVYNGITIDKLFTISKSRAGINGTSGSRGTVNIARAITGTAWLDSEAVTALSSNGYGAPMNRDIVTLYNTASSFSVSKFYNGTSWVSLDAYVNGNMLVEGTVSTRELAADAVTAEKINVTNLAAVATQTGSLEVSGTVKSANNAFQVDSLGNMTATSATLKGSIRNGSYTGYAWPAAGAGNIGYYLGAEGMLLGNANNGKYFQVTADGNLYMPGMYVENGILTVSALNVINTANVAGNAITTTVNAYTSGSVTAHPQNGVTVQTVSLSTTGSRLLLFFTAQINHYSPNGYPWAVRILRNGGLIYEFNTTGDRNGASIALSCSVSDTPASGTHTYSAMILGAGDGSLSAQSRSLTVMEIKR